MATSAVLCGVTRDAHAQTRTPPKPPARPPATPAATAPTTGAPQGLRIKTGLAASGISGCASFPPPAVVPNATPNAEAEAQRLISAAQEAALQGEHGEARDAFARAAALVPGNARVAYYLGRELEALAESNPAVREYCRYLALSPAAPDADDVRGRIVRLTPATELARVEDARANFRSGVALLQRKQYAAADSAFATVVRQVPAAPEPYFNRALARAARGERTPAMQDFEKYLELAPQATDRAMVRTSMSRLPERVYAPGQSLGLGLLVPGLGQMTTGRPVVGIVILGASAAGIGIALKQVPELRVQRFTDPFGTEYLDSSVVNGRPNAASALTLTGVVWLSAALEGMLYARRSHANAESIIARTPLGDRAVGLAVRALPRSRLGLGVTLSAPKRQEQRVTGPGSR